MHFLRRIRSDSFLEKLLFQKSMCLQEKLRVFKIFNASTLTWVVISHTILNRNLQNITEGAAFIFQRQLQLQPLTSPVFLNITIKHFTQQLRHIFTAFLRRTEDQTWFFRHHFADKTSQSVRIYAFQRLCILQSEKKSWLLKILFRLKLTWKVARLQNVSSSSSPASQLILAISSPHFTYSVSSTGRKFLWYTSAFKKVQTSCRLPIVALIPTTWMSAWTKLSTNRGITVKSWISLF